MFTLHSLATGEMVKLGNDEMRTIIGALLEAAENWAKPFCDAPEAVYFKLSPLVEEDTNE